jgi:curved DNA-binding protein CbpA
MSSSDRDPKELRERAQKLLAQDYFIALGVARAASADEVKRAFVEAAKRWHPDRVPDGLDELRPLYAKVFARLEIARATISDPARRDRYIEELAKPSKAATAGEVSSAEAALEFRKAEALLKKNDAVQAERHLRRAVQLAPNMVAYQVLLVWLQAKPGSTPDELRKLVVDLDRLIAKDQECERAWFYRGQLRKRLDLVKEAHADFVRASELDPNNIETQREVRIYKMRQEKTPETRSSKQAEGDGPFGFIKKLFKK